jgi:ParB family chromosome partitioning protein
MNTATHQETQALHAVAAATVTAYDLLLIPLSQLRPSSRNVRKSGGASIPELASSIARVGLLQNLTVTASSRWRALRSRRRQAASGRIEAAGEAAQACQGP